jgi:tRNA(Ile)-lysidine synthase
VRWGCQLEDAIVTPEHAVDEAIRRHRLAGSRLLVAVSGGADSVALLRAIVSLSKRYQLEPEVAHVNHRWRGADSDADEQFVVELAESWGLPVHVRRAEAALSPDGCSEEAARDLRYAFLEQVANDRSLHSILVGHQQQDLVETVLFQLLRGSGLRGLAGMRSERTLSSGTRLIRPLLAVTREAIETYLSGLEQSYRTDVTNLDPKFARGHLRTRILPECEALNPRVHEAIARLAEQAADWRDEAEASAQALLVRSLVPTTDDTLRLNRAVLCAATEGARRELFRALWRSQGWSEQAMSAEHWQRLSELAETEGALSLPGNLQARSLAQWLTIQP